MFNVELNTDEEPSLFKAQLYAITSVAIDRQKVLFKGKQIQDTWDNIQIKDGVTLLMMGSQEDIPQAPEKKTVFMEDLSENKLTELLQLPAGLENLGKPYESYCKPYFLILNNLLNLQVILAILMLLYSV